MESKIVPRSATDLTPVQRTGADLFNAQKSLEEAKHKVDFQYSRMQIEGQKDKISKALAKHADVARFNYNEAQDLHQLMSSAERKLQFDYAKRLETSLADRNSALAQVFKTIEPNGDRSALASAKNIIDEAMNKAIKEIENTSGVKAGDVKGLAEKLEEAVRDKDMAAIVAFTNKLGRSQNNGIVELRRQLTMHEAAINSGASGLTRDDLDEWKLYIDANSDINVAAEDIGSWSRERSTQTLEQRWQSFDTWKDMTLEAWARQKKSSQFASMRAGFIDHKKAKYILDTDDLRTGLKDSVIKELELIVQEEGTGPRKRPLNKTIITELNQPKRSPENPNGWDPASDTLEDLSDYREINEYLAKGNRGVEDGDDDDD
jgi:hypothetical protein